MLHALTTRLLDTLFPRHCLLCGDPAHGRALCNGCLADLPYNEIACPRCALPMTAFAPLCRDCLERPPPFDHACAPLRYAEPAAWLITALKFHRQLACAELLGNLLAERISAEPTTLPEVVVPVPLHPSRQRSRGFNQAIEIARPLARRLALPLEIDACRRQRATAVQSELPARQRRANLDNAFRIHAGFQPRTVAIVDDVMTTGSTAAALTRALKESGVEEVQVWCCARA